MLSPGGTRHNSMSGTAWYEDNAGAQVARRRLRRLVQILKTPSDFWLILRVSSWALILPLLKRTIPLKTLARVLWNSSERSRNFSQELKIAKIVQWIYAFAYSKDKSCLQRSLLLYRYLSMNNSGPQLITGMKRDADKTWKGHAWILVDGKPFADFESNASEFQPLVAFEKEGAMRKLSS